MKIIKANYCPRCKQLFAYSLAERCLQCGGELKVAIASHQNFFVAQDAEIISCEPLKK